MIKRISIFWDRSLLLSPWFLQALFWVNVAGTLYGYEWYRGQLIQTWNDNSGWLVLFVPDSPTASLFFSITIWYLIRDGRRAREGIAIVPPKNMLTWRGVWEGLAVITQVKYGIWAVSIIFWGASQGDPIVWQEWMLVFSHSAMAIEALLYMRFYTFTTLAVSIGALWTLTNDYIDYTFGVFPYLPQQLYDELGAVQLFTVSLSALGIACAYAGVRWARKNRV